jgi:glycosyltransferase involved in cell wall biosynthesis
MKNINKITCTIILPCLNESETLAVCISKGFASLNRLGIDGEIIVADNGSTDGSQKIALNAGARLINVPTRGYGAALIGGIDAAKSDFIIMADADDSYALDDLSDFIDSLKAGNDLVIGNRFKGGIAPGAMPWLHKYVGNPVLSFIGRMFFKIKIGDFHCGLRAFRVNSIRSLKLKSIGMEFASEMVVKAAVNKLKIAEVPTTLKPAGRSRAPHLRTWHDGMRHLIFLLTASPRWLFLYPGLFLSSFGLIGIALTVKEPFTIAYFQLDLNAFLLFIGLIIVGSQTVLFGILARVFATNFGTLPSSKSVTKFEKFFSLERGIIIGLSLLSISVIIALFLLGHWSGQSITGISRDLTIRISGVIILSSTIGSQILFASFFASMLQTKKS